MDENVPFAIAAGLRQREVDVLTTQEDGMRARRDSEVFDRAVALGRVLFSHDEDMLKESAARQEGGKSFTGLAYAHQNNITIRQAVEELELLAKVLEPSDFRNNVQYLPLGGKR